MFHCARKSPGKHTPMILVMAKVSILVIEVDIYVTDLTAVRFNFFVEKQSQATVPAPWNKSTSSKSLRRPASSVERSWRDEEDR